MNISLKRSTSMGKSGRNLARTISLTLTASLLFSTLTIIAIPSAQAATITATGTNPSVCNQEVDITTGVTAERLANGNCVVRFTSASTINWSVPVGVTTVEVLVVGGGGGAGGAHDNASSGGGGAGYVYANASENVSGTIAISAGSGGTGGVGVSLGAVRNGNSGGDSRFGSVTALGGGGGRGGYFLRANVGATGGTAATLNQSSSGGNDGDNTGNGFGGGGQSSTSNQSGGAGVSNSITGTAITYGTGGTGGTKGSNTSPAAQPAGTGNGGTGAAANASTGRTGGAGGSGIVVISYTIPASTFLASNYTAGSTTWANSITGATAGTAPAGGMTKTSSGPSGVVFAGKESSSSDQISSSIGSTTSLDTVTVEMWIKLKDAGNDQNASGSMLFSWNTSPNNYNVYHFGNQVGFNNFNSQLYGIDSTSYNNAWTHFVFVMTDTGPWSSQKIYVNGTLQASTCRISSGNCGDASARSFASNGNFLLMDHPNSSNTWNAKGDLGLVRIYNQELSAASVLSAYNLTSPDFMEAPDTTAPTFTSSSSFSAAENIATSATAATIRVSESATVTISSGADAARFNITRSETDTAIIKFNTSPDFEAPADVGGNNVYDLTLTATDAAANSGTQSITITVTNLVDTSSFNSLALAGSATAATYRTVVVITANVTVASRVTFRVNGKVLPECKNRLASGSSSSFSATCNWRPSNRGQVNLTAAATPTGAGISGTTSNPVTIMVGKRVGAR